MGYLGGHVTERGVEWGEWEGEGFTVEEASNRLMILRKMVEGRGRKGWGEVAEALRRRVQG